MTNILKLAGVAIAGIVVGYAAHVFMNQVSVGGVYNQVVNSFPSATLGDKTIFYKSGIIGPGANQASYLNDTGKAIFIPASSVTIGYTSGTATSSWLFYVSTSTASTVTDYARSPGSYLMIDGAALATSTLADASWITGTSTNAGKGGVMLQPNERLIFNVQERYACKANALCETATSTNRGVQSFSWFFRAVY